LNSYFAELGGFQPIDRVSLRPDDLDPFFVAYDWDPQITLAALQSRSTTMTHNVGGVLQFAGYDLSAVPFTPGDTVQLVTLWRVVQKPETGDSDLVIFTHALDGLDAGGQIVGQQDRLDAPAWSWQTGDLVAQMHRFNLRDDLSPGPLTLQVGVYRRADGTRLPILTDGAAVDDRIILQTVEVIAP